MDLVPMSGAAVDPEPEKKDSSPVADLAAGEAFSMVLAAMGVPPVIGDMLEMGHHAAEMFEGPGGEGPAPADNSANIDPGALRPDARLRMR